MSETGEKLETETGNVYTLTKLLGRGAFGAVYLADGVVDSSPARTFAVKKIETRPRVDTTEARQEFAVSDSDTSSCSI